MISCLIDKSFNHMEKNPLPPPLLWAREKKIEHKYLIFTEHNFPKNPKLPFFRLELTLSNELSQI